MDWFYYIINILIMLTLCMIYYKRSNTSSVINYFWMGLLVKIGFTIFVGHYYSAGDSRQIFKYTENMNGIYEMDSFAAYWKMIFNSDFRSDYWKLGTVYWGNPRTFFFMKIVSLLNMITGKSYWLTSMYLSLFSYFGIFYLLKNIASYYAKVKYTAVFVLLLLPSVVFNSSGILKETLAFGSICFVIGYAIQVNLGVRNVNLWSTIGMLLGLLLLYKMKYYYLAVLMPSLLMYFLLNFVKQITRKRRIFVYLFGVLLLGLFMYSASQYHENLAYDRIVGELSNSHNEGISLSKKGMFIDYSGIPGDIWFLVKNVPQALFYGLYGPFIWESKNLAMAYVSLENLCILILTFFFVYYWVKKKIRLTALGYSLLFYVLILSMVLPLAAPNFGTLVRYKVSYFPFFCIILAGNISFVHRFFERVLHLDFLGKKKT